MSDKSRLLAEAVRLREDDRNEAACAALLALAADFPEDPQIAYQTAWAFDKLGREDDAIPFYESALASDGLTVEERQGALLGLGSSYRLTKRHADSVRTSRQAVDEFPEDLALKAFLALALHDAGQQRAAVNLLLRLLVESSSDSMIQTYRRPLLEYASEPETP